MEVAEFLEHFGVRGQKWGVRKAIKVSTTPWSNFKKSDYTREQWHAACLIHDHKGPSKSKDACKLPVKQPDGVVNMHGVFAAAASLGGARGGVQASASQKDEAAKSLITLYHQIGHEPPPSLLLKHSDVDEFLEHHGIKGMRWGVRGSRQNLDRISRIVRSTKSSYSAHRRSEDKKLIDKLSKQIEKEGGGVLDQAGKDRMLRQIKSGRTATKLILAGGVGAMLYKHLHG